jgi:hypothetical protein
LLGCIIRILVSPKKVFLAVRAFLSSSYFLPILPFALLASTLLLVGLLRFLYRAESLAEFFLLLPYSLIMGADYFLPAIAFTYVSLVITRSLVEMASRARTGIRILGMAAIDIAVMLVLLAIPVILYLFNGGGTLDPRYIFDPMNSGQEYVFLGLANWGVILPTIVYVVLSMLLLLHFIVWPLTLRLSKNFVVDARVFHNRQLLASSGLLFLLLSGFLTTEMLAAIRGLIEGVIGAV